MDIKILLKYVLGIALLPTTSQAIPISLNFSSEFTFSPNSIVASGGQSLGSVLEQSFGIENTSTNTFSVSGTLIFDSDTAPVIADTVTSVGISGEAAGYSNSISNLSLNIAGTNINANIPAINANADTATSGVFVVPTNFGLLNPEIGGSSFLQAKAVIPSTVQTGNAALIGDNLPVIVRGPSGNTNITTASDFIGFSLGTTNINDFGSGFSTDSGLFSVSSLILVVIGNGTEDLFSSTKLPSDDSFFDPTLLDTSIVSLALELENEVSPILLEGEITSFDLKPASPVPTPAAFPLFISALTALGFLVKNKKST